MGTLIRDTVDGARNLIRFGSEELKGAGAIPDPVYQRLVGGLATDGFVTTQDATAAFAALEQFAVAHGGFDPPGQSWFSDWTMAVSSLMDMKSDVVNAALKAEAELHAEHPDRQHGPLPKEERLMLAAGLTFLTLMQTKTPGEVK